MSVLQTDPSVVLVVCRTADRLERVRRAVADGTSVERVGSTDEAADRLSETVEIGCVVVSDDAPDRDVVGDCEAVRDADDLVPVVAVVESGDEALAQRFTAAGGSGYLAVDAADETVREVVEDAVETCGERRRRAANADVLETMFEELGVSMYVKDVEGRYVRAAKVPEGRCPDHLRGKTDLDVYGDEDPEGAREVYEDDLRVVETNEPIFHRRERLDLATGEHYSQTTKVPWLDADGDVRGLVGISWDVTDDVHREKRLARQEERIDEFASVVSHDLRGPLQVANGALEIAREAGSEDAFDRAGDALERIDEMIDDLSTLAHEGKSGTRFEADAVGPVRADVEDATRLTDLVEEVWSVVRADASSLTTTFDDETLVTAPATSVRPVLENLFKNAVVHAGRDVHVRVGPLPDGGLYVEDDGPGVPETDRETVFERGYTTAEAGDGTGLRVVSRIADRHDWSLAVTESSIGGARFEIRNCLLVDDPERTVADGDPVALTDDVDVGDVGVPGDADYDAVTDRWSVRGAGRNVWRQDNEFHFVYATVTGPARVQARITEIDDFREYTKAGVMVRDDLSTDAAYGYVGVTPYHGTELLWRTRPGEDGVSQHVEELSLSFPWYRVDRVGETVTTWVSADGDDWHPIDQRRVALGDPVNVGLVVCSFSPNRLCEAVFEDVTVMASGETRLYD